MVNIASLLKTKRKEAGLKIKTVVEELETYGIKLSEKTIYGYENGDRQPNADLFLVFCRIYGINSFSDIEEDTLLD